MIASFLLALPALFSIVNPISGVFVFRDVTAELAHAERFRLAVRVGLYSLAVMLVALWGGSYVLAFFGISLAALRIAGGIILTGFAAELLHSPEKREARKQTQVAGRSEPMEDIAFFPLTLPLTTGPGTITVAIALGAGRPSAEQGLLPFFAGVSLAAVVMAGLIVLHYGYADLIARLLGPTGSRTVGRLSAFILFCIGVQMVVTGSTDVLGPLLTRP